MVVRRAERGGVPEPLILDACTRLARRKCVHFTGSFVGYHPCSPFTYSRQATIHAKLTLLSGKEKPGPVSTRIAYTSRLEMTSCSLSVRGAAHPGCACGTFSEAHRYARWCSRRCTQSLATGWRCNLVPFTPGPPSCLCPARQEHLVWRCAQG